MMRRNVAFEVIDQESDRHIIKYDTSRLVFLHAIKNTADFHIDHDADKLIDMDRFFNRPEVLAVFHSDKERGGTVEHVGRGAS